MKRSLPLTILLFAVTVAAIAQSPAKSEDPFGRLAFLVGDWVGDGSGDPGNGSGGFTIKPDLEEHVLVRTNYARYPATADRPAYRHDDLMITYPEGGDLKAVYFDNEGHVIHYKISTTANTAVFVSEGPGPGFRLTYKRTDKDHLALKFEISPPDKPGEFKTYIEATAKRL
jgi:hypothetical protein